MTADANPTQASCPHTAIRPMVNSRNGAYRCAAPGCSKVFVSRSAWSAPEGIPAFMVPAYATNREQVIHAYLETLETAEQNDAAAASAMGTVQL